MEDAVTILPSERHVVDYQADMYAAVLSLEHFERAHHRDLLGDDTATYEVQLLRLLDKYKRAEAQLLAAGPGARYDGLEPFLESYGVASSCAAARARLIEAGISRKQQTATAAGGPVNSADANAPGPSSAPGAGTPTAAGPAAAEGPSSNPTPPTSATGGAPKPRMVLEAAQHFITLMDCLKLQQTSADQLHPIVADLIAAVTRVSATFESLGRLTGWLEKLDGMRASDRLDEDAARDMLFDVERSYNAFYRYLDAM